MDAGPIEELQGILRQMLHQATTGHQLNILNSEGLLRRVLIRRTAQVRVHTTPLLCPHAYLLWLQWATTYNGAMPHYGHTSCHANCGHTLTIWQVREKANGLQSFQEAQQAKRSGPQGLGRSLAAWLSCLHQSSDMARAGDGIPGVTAPGHLRAEWTAGPSGNFPVGDWQCREYVRARCHY